jgi:transmembrane sensor
MQEDIHSLLAKYFSGHASAEETGMVKNWAGASEENAADFKLLEYLWNKSGEQEQHVFNTEQAWQTVNTTLQNNRRSKAVRLFTRRAMLAAATIILLLGAWWLFSPSSPARTITADNNSLVVHMSDGSEIFLRKGASIEYRKNYGKTDRHVTLKGEAFFEVQPNAVMPFIITAAETKVQVVGTSFLVNTNNNQVSLVVRTGRVNFSSGDEKVLVTAGEKALYAANHLTKENNSAENFDAWRSKLLVFDKTPLKEAIADINNYYGIDIRFKQGEAAQMESTQITARFNNQSLQTVLDELSLISTYKIRKLDDIQYEISIN